MRIQMTRNRAHAIRIADAMTARTGEVVGRYGRMIETLLGAEVIEQELSGRPLYVVTPVISTRDPLYDA